MDESHIDYLRRTNLEHLRKTNQPWVQEYGAFLNWLESKPGNLHHYDGFYWDGWEAALNWERSKANNNGNRKHRP